MTKEKTPQKLKPLVSLLQIAEAVRRLEEEHRPVNKRNINKMLKQLNHD